MQKRLLVLRELIYDTAQMTPGVGKLEETLKWSEPAYVTAETKSGSVVRIAYSAKRPGQYAMYFICHTKLVDTFRTLFPNDFQFEGNRAIVFDESAAVPMRELGLCISMALTYRLSKTAREFKIKKSQ
jgi:Domain of unknown function (DU1801)